jgi:hypothetical protein
LRVKGDHLKALRFQNWSTRQSKCAVSDRANSMSLRKKKKKKKTALIVCRDGKEFWTTQTQYWQWLRDGRLIQIGNNPLTGAFCREDEELMVILSNTVLNLAHPNHIREALNARRVGLAGR